MRLAFSKKTIRKMSNMTETDFKWDETNRPRNSHTSNLKPFSIANANLPSMRVRLRAIGINTELPTP